MVERFLQAVPVQAALSEVGCDFRLDPPYLKAEMQVQLQVGKSGVQLGLTYPTSAVPPPPYLTISDALWGPPTGFCIEALIRFCVYGD